MYYTVFDSKRSNELVQLERAVGVHAQFEWPKLPRTCSGLGLGLGLGLGFGVRWIGLPSPLT